MWVRSFKYFVLLAFLSAGCSTAFAGDLEKAYKYLNTGDYANARKYLFEAYNDEPTNPAANFGLARFYTLKDNKAFNLDSANIFIKKAAAKLPIELPEHQMKKLLALGVRDYTIKNLQQDINQLAYSVAEKENTVESYQHIIDDYTDSGLINRSVVARNQLAFIRAQATARPSAVDSFTKMYPDADQVKDAKDLYEKWTYEQTTANKTYQEYKKYMDMYPKGAYYAQAKKNYQDKLLEYYNMKHDVASYLEFEKIYKDHPAYNNVDDSIYVLLTKTGTPNSFLNIVRNYKTNRNYNDAWTQFYILYTQEATEDVYRKFAEEYPDFPDKARLNRDMELSKLNLKPFQQGTKWGYAAQPQPDSMVVVIPFEYEEAFGFSCGWAVVRSVPCNDSQCVYLYIDKGNQVALPFRFNYAGDFEHGQAIVGTGNCEKDSCKYGIVDKRGHWVVYPDYDELNDPTEGLYLVSKNDRYGFVDSTGQIVINLRYTNGVPFSEGVASVALDSNWFFIDRTGRQISYDYYRDISAFKDGLCAVTKDGENWGYINKSGAFVVDPVYESAEDFENGFGIVSKKEPDPKHKGFFVSQRYKIDHNGKLVEKLTAPVDKTKKQPAKKKRTR